VIVRTVTVDVTQDDIDQANATGGPNQMMIYCYCPVALATSRALGYDVDCLDNCITLPRSNAVLAYLPGDETQRVSRYDNGKGMEPHRFELTTEEGES